MWAGDRGVGIRNIKPLKPWGWLRSPRERVEGIGNSPRTEPSERTSIWEVWRGSGTYKRNSFHGRYNEIKRRKHLMKEGASNSGRCGWGFSSLRIRARHWFANKEVIGGFKEKDFNGAEVKVKWCGIRWAVKKWLQFKEPILSQSLYTDQRWRELDYIKSGLQDKGWTFFRWERLNFLLYFSR